MNRRAFLGQLIGGIAAAAAVRTWPFTVYSFPSVATRDYYRVLWPFTSRAPVYGSSPFENVSGEIQIALQQQMHLIERYWTSAPQPILVNPRDMEAISTLLYKNGDATIQISSLASESDLPILQEPCKPCL